MTERAQGGPIDPSRQYAIGERGQEVFVPSTSGYIVGGYTPSAATAIIMTSPTITMNTSPPGLAQFTIDQLREEIRRRGGDDGSAGVAARLRS